MDSIKPNFIGLSYAVAIVSFFSAMYLTTLLAWCVNYFLFSFQSPLPWDSKKIPTFDNVFWRQDYFQADMLHTSKGIGDYNYIVPWIVFSFVISGAINYLTIFKSLRSAGYVIYIITPLPYILLFLLLLEELHLMVSLKAGRYLLKPDFSNS